MSGYFVLVTLILTGIGHFSVGAWVTQYFNNEGHSSLPDAVWPNVSALYLKSNVIVDAGLRPFPILPELKTFNLDYNLLTEFPDLVNVSGLRDLYLRGNRISFIDQQRLEILTSLQTFLLSNNLLASFPDVVLPVWRGLDLSYNPIDILPKICQVAPLSVYVFMRQVNLREVPPDTFVGCTKLINVYSNKANLDQFPYFSPETASTIEKLDFRDNFITSIPDFNHFQSLNVLQLDGNPLLVIPNMLKLPPTLTLLSITGIVVPCNFDLIKIINAIRKSPNILLDIDVGNSLNECFDSASQQSNFSTGLTVNLQDIHTMLFKGNMSRTSIRPISSDEFLFGWMPAPLPLTPGMTPLECARTCRMSPTCAMFYLRSGTETRCGLTDVDNMLPVNGTKLEMYMD